VLQKRAQQDQRDPLVAVGTRLGFSQGVEQHRTFLGKCRVLLDAEEAGSRGCQGLLDRSAVAAILKRRRCELRVARFRGLGYSAAHSSRGSLEVEIARRLRVGQTLKRLAMLTHSQATTQPSVTRGAEGHDFLIVARQHHPGRGPAGDALHDAERNQLLILKSDA
jgi:hypothetical protein